MVKLAWVPQQCKGKNEECVFNLWPCNVGCRQSGQGVPLIPARHDPTWKPGPFISAHPCLASAWLLETILGKESDKTPIRHMHYSTPTKQGILR